MARKPKQVNADICKNDIKPSPIRNKKAYKNDFITLYEDAENEVLNYKEQFDGMKVLCPCNDLESGIGLFFANNFKELKLKELCLVEYKEDDSDARVVTFTKNNKEKYGFKCKEETIEGWNGDVFSDHLYNKKLWSKNGYNIIVTNIGGAYAKNDNRFTKLVLKCVNYMKKFLIVGNSNAIIYKEIFPLIKENKMCVGVNYFCGKMPYFIVPKEFVTENDRVIVKEDGTILRQVNFAWFTNLEHNKRNEVLELTKTYSNEYYSKYDNYDAIEVSKTCEIPMDYDGVMGVPITFLDKYNPNQFEIVGLAQGSEEIAGEYYLGIIPTIKYDGGRARAYINGKAVYSRILIRHKR